MGMFDSDEPFDPDFSSKERWAEVPEPIRKEVDQHVRARLPAEVLAKLHDLHTRGIPISSDSAFFHFGGGLAVRNLCRERLSDHKLATCSLRRRLGRLLYRGARRDRCFADLRAVDTLTRAAASRSPVQFSRTC